MPREGKRRQHGFIMANSQAISLRHTRLIFAAKINSDGQGSVEQGFCSLLATIFVPSSCRSFPHVAFR